MDSVKFSKKTPCNDLAVLIDIRQLFFLIEVGRLEKNCLLESVHREKKLIGVGVLG